MSNKEENPSLTGYYSVEKFIKELKKVSGLPENFDDNDDFFQSTPIQTSPDNNIIYLSPYRKDRDIDKDNLYSSTMNKELNDNEKIKTEMTKLRKENAELKFALNNINKKFDNELKEIKKNNELKNKELKQTKDIMNKNASLIELLGEKISNYEKLVSELKEKQNSEQKESLKDDDDNNNKYMALFENNKKLKKELMEKDNMINNIKNELNTKNEIFDEINTMKSEMETYLQTMDKLYSEIESRDGIIKKLKNDIQVIQNNYQEELNDLKKQKTANNNTNKNKNNIKDKNIKNEKADEKLLEELNQNKEKEIQLNKELVEIRKSYKEMKESNEKMKELAKETNGMIKTAIDSRDNLKKEYESSIKEIVEKYEKQIKFMKMVLVKQKEEYEEKLKNKKSGKINENNIGDDNKKDEVVDKNKNKNKEKKDDEKEKEEETKVYEMMKIIEDNKELLRQNEKLKNMNETILSRMKELPNLEQKYTDLFETVKLLQEENHLLKEASKYSSLIELSEGRIKDMSAGINNNKNINTIPNEKKTKNLLLDDDEDDDDDSNQKDKKENKDEKGNKNQNQNKKVPAIKQEEIVFEKMNKSNSDISNSNDNSQIKVYNKKKLPRQTPPKVSKDNNFTINKSTIPNNNITDNLDNNENNDNNNINVDENENENEETVKDETENDSINSNFNLYKPIKEGLLAFNLSKKNYFTVVPEKYNEFWESFDPETSVQYNTLEGLFLINAKKNNQLYYYSSKKNTISALFEFKENHTSGCLFLDNLSKNIIAIGGKNSKLVEKFSFENGHLEQLPPLSTHRSKITCCQVLNKIYCFLGICEEKPDKSIIEYLDLDNLEQGWIDVQFDNQTSFKILTGMSCVNLNDSELFIIGGLINDKLPNEKLLYFNTEQNELFELNKDLPDSEEKNYIFTKNTMFNLFLNGDIISFTNIDDNNQVHILDNELKYDLYLTPKI